MCFIFLVCAFLIWVEKWGSTCQHSCLDIMVGDAATFLPFFFLCGCLLGWRNYWWDPCVWSIKGGYVSRSSNLIGPNYKLLAMGIDPNYKLNHPLIYVECDHWLKCLELCLLIMGFSWMQHLFTDDKGVATFKGIPFMTSGGPCTCSIPKASIKWPWRMCSVSLTPITVNLICWVMQTMLLTDQCLQVFVSVFKLYILTMETHHKNARACFFCLFYCLLLLIWSHERALIYCYISQITQVPHSTWAWWCRRPSRSER